MYLFIAYKPSSDDYCRGCHMASYSSDFSYNNNLTLEELLIKWSDFLYKNLNLDYNESGYQFYIFKNGILVYEDQYSTWDGFNKFSDAICDDKFEEIEKQKIIDMNEIEDLYHKAKLLADKKKVEIEEKLFLEHNKTKEFISQQAKEERKKEYEKLKLEFANE